jgi:Plasmid pRiA4b ORF-3-like protein
MSVAGHADGVCAYQLRVTLRGVSPLVWRRLLVRSDATIAQLHDLLQIAMGWEDAHLHQFRIHGKAYGVYRGAGFTFADNPRSVRLADFRLRRGERFSYQYDFTDVRHEVVFSSVMTQSRRI